jgi:Tol biopolymer transport system component
MGTYTDFAPTQRFWNAVAMAPDGSAVAYVADAGGQLNLVVQDSDGSAGRPLTQGTDWSVRQVAWSPDSATLFFTADRDGDENFQVFSVRRDGTDQRQLTDAPKAAHYLAPDPVSPDGRWLAYAGNDREPADQDVLLRDLDSGDVRRLVDTGGFLEPGHWSPDSTAVTVQDARSNTDIGVMVARVDGSVSPLLAGRPGQHLSVGWSAGGDAIVLRTDLDRDFMALVRVSVPDGEVTWLDEPEWDIEHATVDAGAGSASGR